MGPAGAGTRRQASHRGATTSTATKRHDVLVASGRGHTRLDAWGGSEAARRRGCVSPSRMADGRRWPAGEPKMAHHLRVGRGRRATLQAHALTSA